MKMEKTALVYTCAVFAVLYLPLGVEVLPHLAK